MSDNLEVAKECGVRIKNSVATIGGKVCAEVVFTATELETYTSRILASQQAAHDVEIAKLRREIGAVQEDNEIANERIAYLEGLVALQADALNDAYADYSNVCGRNYGSTPSDSMQKVKAAISASAETVQALRDKLTEPLQKLSVTNILLRVVAGWDGSGEEVYAKTVADVEAELTRLACLVEDYETGEKVSPYAQSVIEPLRREVAMLRAAIVNASKGYPDGYFDSELSNTQATAQAYEQEVEAREAVKALEVLVKLCDSCGFHQNCPTRNDDGGLCDDYIAQPKEPKQ